MGKKQHSKDRMYITATEWKEHFGGHKDKSANLQHRRLPFDRCSLSFTPFETPVCTPDGYVFDILNIVPYIKKNKVNPVTGQGLKSKELTRLTYHKNTDGKFMCPITFKVFVSYPFSLSLSLSLSFFLLLSIYLFSSSGVTAGCD